MIRYERHRLLSFVADVFGVGVNDRAGASVATASFGPSPPDPNQPISTYSHA